jgi:serine/threonine-protein kinase
MSYAHGEGVVHCDLKPANVVLTSDNTPKITDFGLARRVDAASGSHSTGDIFGTIPYMAPEQAAGRIRDVGPLSDVYGLGTILYEMLTGQPPFQGTVVETLRKILHKPPTRPRRLQRPIPHGLESICLKCLEKKPRRRYASAQALADDLGRWIEAKRPTADSAAARTARWARRRPILHAVIALIALILVSASIAVPLAYYHLDPDRVVKDYQIDLERGNSVTLIGETGPPRWMKRVINEGNVIASPLNDGVFSVSSPPFHDVYMELLPAGRARGCRYSVQMRLEMLENGEAGIVCGHSAFSVSRGTEHCFCVLRTFADRDGSLQADLDILRRLIPTRRLLRTSATLKPPTKLPALPAAKWRELRLDITPEEVRAFIDEICIGVVDRPSLLRLFQTALNHTSDQDTYEPSLEPSFMPAEGLGIFLKNGWASFRSAFVQPLDE